MLQAVHFLRTDHLIVVTVRIDDAESLGDLLVVACPTGSLDWFEWLDVACRNLGTVANDVFVAKTLTQTLAGVVGLVLQL